jgi:hypothetical protein
MKFGIHGFSLLFAIFRKRPSALSRLKGRFFWRFGMAFLEDFILPSKTKQKRQHPRNRLESRRISDDFDRNSAL